MLAVGDAEPVIAVLKSGTLNRTQHGSAASGLRAVLLESRAELVRFIAARGAADEAEDLIQDLFLRLGRPVGGPIADPRAYLYRMADNLLLDRRRSAARRAIREDAWIDAYSEGFGAMDDRNAEDALMERQRLQMVTAALSLLPERTVTVFRRFRIDGEPQKAIAAELGISVSAVEKHLQRAYHVVGDVRRRWDADLRLPKRPKAR